ncbi:MAG: NfeD family protein [Kiritimatiellae bacterium]|nr:NfeD family protein [Kiritimatiellia bacterium]
MFTCAWIWIYAGSVLMLLELIVPGFVLCFFGLSAATVGVLRFVFGEAFDATWQLAAFSACSILYIVVLRRYLKKIFVGSMQDGSDFDHESVGRIGRVTAAINPPLTGRVMLGDSEWSASAAAPIAEGVNVRVVAQNNLTMEVAAV